MSQLLRCLWLKPDPGVQHPPGGSPGVSLSSGSTSGIIMPPGEECNADGCHNTVPQRQCAAVGGPFCGSHCDCHAHDKRTKRKGNTRGRASQTSFESRKLAHIAYRGFREAIGIVSDLSASAKDTLGITSGRTVVIWLVTSLRELISHQEQGTLDSLPTRLHALEEILQPTVVGRAMDAFALAEARLRGEVAPASGASSGSAAVGDPVDIIVVPEPSGETTHRATSPPRLSVSSSAPSIVMQGAVKWFSEDDRRQAQASMSACTWPSDVHALPELAADLTFLPGGSFPWNVKSNKPSPLIRLQTGPHPVCAVQRNKEASMQAFVNTGAPQGSAPVASAQCTVNMLAQFLYSRPGCWDRLGGQLEVPAELQETQTHGRFLGTNVRHLLPNLPSDGAWETAYHGTSMSSVYRILMVGFESGFAVISDGGRSREGVYCHVMERAGLCLNYMVYSPLDASGYYIAPLFQLRFQKPDPQGRSQIVKRSKKSMHQTLTYADNCVVVGVYWHVMHWSELCLGDRSLWIAMEARFKANFEVDPLDLWDTVAQRSRTACVKVLMLLLSLVRWTRT
jgi:hypothetical protein